VVAASKNRTWNTCKIPREKRCVGTIFVGEWDIFKKHLGVIYVEAYMKN
jgi:hypothetical protein